MSRPCWAYCLSLLCLSFVEELNMKNLGKNANNKGNNFKIKNFCSSMTPSKNVKSSHRLGEEFKYLTEKYSCQKYIKKCYE